METVWLLSSCGEVARRLMILPARVSNVPPCDDNLGRYPFSLSCCICPRLLNTGLDLGLVCLLDGRYGGYSASTPPSPSPPLCL